jgi:hypothetical protein
VSSGDGNRTNRGGTRWSDRPVTGLTPHRIFSPHPSVIYLSRGTNLPGEHELRRKITRVRFTVVDIFPATVPWRSSSVPLSEQLAGPHSPIFVLQLTNLHVSKLLSNVPAVTLLTDTLLKHPLNPPQIDLKVHPSSLMVKMQS